MDWLISFVGNLTTLQLAIFALAFAFAIIFCINFVWRCIYWITFCYKEKNEKYDPDWMDYNKWRDDP